MVGHVRGFPLSSKYVYTTVSTAVLCTAVQSSRYNMRLINTTTFEFKEFSDRELPQYAILSHRWGHEECTHEDFAKLRRLRNTSDDRLPDEILAKNGYRKIQSFCKIAHARGLQYAWADTCCIDKTSATELSEAINSMARWYAQADVCIVYLPDVSLLAENEARDVFQQLEESEWFNRGWTLQELLMPRKLIFYSASWERIGALDKDRALIGQALSAPLNLSPSTRGFLSSLERASHIKIDDLCIMTNIKPPVSPSACFGLLIE